jgi:NAD(P)-dependent dehydrogenase (short-subunit alcohol dehydrogenase family)
VTTPFGAKSSADDVLTGRDLSGQRILVTGVSSGIGLETARALVAHGANVIGAARDLTRAREATKQIQNRADGSGKFELVELDLASLLSVTTLADRLLEAGEPLTAIIANAGVLGCPQSTTEEGFETHFGTNHIGHFVLTNRLVPLLKHGSRVIALSSAVHGVYDIDLDDPNIERTPYHEIMAYGRSKTANVLFTVEFDRRFQKEGIRAMAVHPGAIHTNLNRHMTPEVIQRLSAGQTSKPREPQPEIVWKSIPQGAATSVWASCVAPVETIAGRYCADCGPADIASGPRAQTHYAGHQMRVQMSLTAAR